MTNFVGGSGNDLFVGTSGQDTFDGGAGEDTIRISDLDNAIQGIVADMRNGTIANDGFGNSETMVNIENFQVGSVFVDMVDGDNGANRLLTNGVGDILNGHGGDDFIFAHAAGTFDGGAGIDRLQLQAYQYHAADGTAGNGLDGSFDTIEADQDIVVNMATGQIINDGYGNSGTFSNFENLSVFNYITAPLDVTVTGSSGDNDILFDITGNATAFAGAGNDTIRSFGGDDFIDGGTGADIMTAGNGNDTYFVDNVGDVVIEQAGEGFDIVNTTLNTYFLTDGDALERVNFQGTGNFVTRGNELDNRFTGAAGNDRFVLDSGGADIFSGGQGRDAFDARSSTTGVTVRLDNQTLNDGDAAGDTFASIESFFGSLTASDFMQTGAARARFSGFGGEDTLIGGASVDFLQGGADNDTLFGNAARDTLQGGTGDDMMTGGVDRDQFLFVEAGFGQDTILDFEDDLDYLKVFSAVADDFSDFIVTGNGTDTVTLTLDDGTGDNVITLISHDGSNMNITADDFLFY